MSSNYNELSLDVQGQRAKSFGRVVQDFADKKTSNGLMMMFEDYRLSLGGADAKWGTKVFYKSLIDLEVLEKSDNRYCPTTKMMDKYGDLFYYDAEKRQWGVASDKLNDWNDIVLEPLVNRAKIVREQLEEAKKIRQRAMYIANKKSTIDSLF